eukprot:TRINITY_DN17590_c3_g1_i1.p1 TRINITY_DN17590_c3_g1~~TRINITY_DN17590_c3_g1_i1.p1  ORF type:complete len:106 (+),score=25.87 TRINITY_DN17590_c3_g1_i1:182-499(+)
MKGGPYAALLFRANGRIERQREKREKKRGEKGKKKKKKEEEVQPAAVVVLWDAATSSCYCCCFLLLLLHPGMLSAIALSFLSFLLFPLVKQTIGGGVWFFLPYCS